MRKLVLVLLCASLLLGQMAYPVASQGQERDGTVAVGQEVLTKSATIRGTTYTAKVNTSNHTVVVSAIHIADNETQAGYSIWIDGTQISNVGWVAKNGETHRTGESLIYHYDTSKTVHELTVGVVGGSLNFIFNLTVPRKYEGRYLRPTITDTEFERVNGSWGRIHLTVRSDAPFYYGAYVLVWVPDSEVRSLNMVRETGENVTRASVVVPLERGEPFEGEIRMHPLNVSKSGPLHTQYTFRGEPGNVSLEEVPYDPISKSEFDSYSYGNGTESGSAGASSELTSGSLFRLVVGGVAVFVVVLVVLGVVLGSRRRV